MTNMVGAQFLPQPAGGFVEVQPELHENWVSETLSWSEAKGKRKAPNSNKISLKSSPNPSTVSSGSSASFLGSKSANSSTSSRKPNAGSFVSPSTQGMTSVPPTLESSSSGYADSPQSAFGGNLPSSVKSQKKQRATSQSPPVSTGKQVRISTGVSKYSSESATPKKRPARAPPAVPKEEESQAKRVNTAIPKSISSNSSLSGRRTRILDGAGAPNKKTAVERIARSTNSERGKQDVHDAEFDSQRRELDDLMDKVLQLQNQRRFKEAKPYMTRIEHLQKKIEKGWEIDHLEKTGSPPASLPQQKQPQSSSAKQPIRRSKGTTEGGLSVSLSNLGLDDFGEEDDKNTSDGSNGESDEFRTPKPILDASAQQASSTHSMHQFAPAPFVPTQQGSMMEVSTTSPDLGTALNTPVLLKTCSNQSSESDEDTFEENVDFAPSLPNSAAKSSKRGLFSRLKGKAKSGVESTKPGLVPAPVDSASQSERKQKGRRWSLSKQSDYFMLVGAEEEEEIIKTLKNREKRRPLSSASFTSSVSTLSTASSVFAKPSANKKLKSPKSDQPAKERVMLTMQGYMYKSPPENKRFSRWHNRYFTLAGPLLSYRTKPGASTSRLIDLKEASAEVVHLKYYSSKGRHEIRIKPKGSKRVYRLREKSKRKVLEWYVAILNNIKVSEKEGDVAKVEKRRREKQKNEKQDPSWAPPKEPSRLGDDITEAVGDEDIYAFYKTLGVTETATAGIIKKKYRELAREYHPDKNRGNTDITRFAEIARAFETLQSPESRSSYDLCERVKKLFRAGVLFTLHETNGPPRKVVMFMDQEFKLLIWQDSSLGSRLAPGYKYVHIRFIQEILAGSDGFDCPPGRADCCLTLHGARLGCSLGMKEACSINLQVETKAARDDILDGFRVLRCRFSELFKQRLEKMKEEGMR